MVAGCKEPKDGSLRVTFLSGGHAVYVFHWKKKDRPLIESPTRKQLRMFFGLPKGDVGRDRSRYRARRRREREIRRAKARLRRSAPTACLRSWSGWGYMTRSRVRRHFKVGRERFSAAARTFERLIDSRAKALKRVRRKLCNDNPTGARAQRRLQASLACLERRSQELEGILARLSYPKDPYAAVSGGIEAVLELPPAELCADSHELPRSRQTTIAELDKRTARHHATVPLTRRGQAASLLNADTAKRLHFAPLRIRMHLANAAAFEHAGDLEKAKLTLGRVAHSRSGDDVTHARLLVQRVGFEPDLRRRALKAVSALHIPDFTIAFYRRSALGLRRAGRYRDAERDLTRATRLVERHHGKQSVRVLPIASALGQISILRGAPTYAARLLANAHSIAERALGADYPLTLMLRARQAEAELLAGKDVRATTRRIAEKMMRALPPGAPRRLWTRLLYGRALAARRDSGAKRAIDWALEGLAKLDKSHPRLIPALLAKSRLLRRRSASAALRPAEQALSIALVARVEPLVRAEVQLTLGLALWESRRDRARAIRLVRNAQTSYKKHGAYREADRAGYWLRDKRP